MKLQKVKIALLATVLSYGLVFAQGQSSGNPVYDFFGVYNGSFKMLNFYVEYATGDLSSLGKDPKGKRGGRILTLNLHICIPLKKFLGLVLVLYYKLNLTSPALIFLLGKKEAERERIIVILFLWLN